MWAVLVTYLVRSIKFIVSADDTVVYNSNCNFYPGRTGIEISSASRSPRRSPIGGQGEFIQIKIAKKSKEKNLTV